jgi:prepilin-type N-terminal cleavage/methylation domain-containing protein
MKRLGLRTKVARVLRGRSRGVTLIEVLIALALFTIIAIVFISGLTVAARAVFIGDQRTTAESLARAQMEYVKSQAYSEADGGIMLP